ncbi:hypothetical protein [Akkermansia sp.]|nr:hypothetical protein [Akkermansia sp.]MBP8662768.1 hypothetical protein [Akkermansia sp.]MBT8779846.1 hypothetical protein [Akkermansia muciniphila]
MMNSTKMKNVRNKILIILLILIPFSLMNLFGKEQLEVTIKNQDEIPVKAFISLERDNSFFQKIINPVGSFYHNKSTIYTEDIKGKGKLKNIRNGDRLVLFTNRSILPIQLQLKGKDIYQFTLNSTDLPPLPEENGMKRDPDCVLFTFEIQDMSIKLLHIEYAWSAEGNQRCKAMELTK